MTYDITFERDPLDRADPEPDWAGEIPAHGEPSPDPRTATYLRLVAGGSTPEEAAAIVDAGFMDRAQYAEHYEEAA